MPRYLSLKKKSSVQAITATDEDSSISSSSSSRSVSFNLKETPRKSSTPTKVKELPGKVAKGVKRQFQRLDDILHHVTHTKHKPSTVSEMPPRKRAVSFPAIHISSFPRPSPSRSRGTWQPKYVRDADLSPSSSSEQLPLPTPAEIAEMAQEQKLQPLPPSDEPAFPSPPTVYIEPEVPDPFLIDEEGDAVSEEEDGSSAAVTASPAHDVPLDLPPSPSPSNIAALASPLPNLNKDVPPPPSSESEQDDEEVPDLYVPALILPTMFLPIPNTDPLTTLLNKYIYPPERRPARDVTGEWQRMDFHTLVMTNSWRALARMARDRLVTADASDLTLILGLWHLRLSCLARLRLFNQTSAECTNLFAVLNAIEPPESRAYVFERLLPFELEVMQTRLKYWTGDHMGYLDVLSALLKKCRNKCRAVGDDATLLPMWKERGARVALILASQMVEMKEITAAAKLLEPLCKQGSVSSPALRSSVARIYLQGGNLQAAAQHFAIVEADQSADPNLKKMNAALLASADGEWVEASERLREVLEQDAGNYVAVNNLSVALLSQGKLKEGIQVLESALDASPASVVVAEPFLFNLSTLYELRSAVGFEKKKELLVDVAKWSGDGLRTNCLKMPAN